MSAGGDQLVPLLAVPDALQASYLVTLLRDDGIEALAGDPLRAGVGAGLGRGPRGIEVMVRAADLARALEALDARRAEATAIDWDAVDVGPAETADDAPARRRTDPPLAARVVAVAALALLALAILAWLVTVGLLAPPRPPVTPR